MYTRYEESVVTVEFEPVDDRTKLCITHVLLPDETQADAHRTGCGAPAEEQGRPSPRPVLTLSDIAHLDGKPPEMVGAALEVCRTFPRTRVLQ